MWRKAEKKDDPQIIEMCLQLNREDPGPKPVPAAHTHNTLQALRQDPVRGMALVLDLGGRVEGYAFLIGFWSNELGGVICTLDEFFVNPSQRSRGHGEALLRSLVEQKNLWPEPYVAVDLEVTPDNSRARAFYQRMGFAAAKNTHMRFRF